MKTSLSLVAIATLLATCPPTMAQNRDLPSRAEGLWLNPRGSVAVQTGDCSGKLCGWIVWANAQAKADAKESGIDHLVGIALLENYVSNGTGSWSGTLYVPDMGHRFSSTITELSPNELKVQGCLIGGFICKSQIWQRIEKAPDA